MRGRSSGRSAAGPLTDTPRRRQSHVYNTSHSNPSPNKVQVVGVRFASFIFYLMGSGLLFGIFSQVIFMWMDGYMDSRYVCALWCVGEFIGCPTYKYV